MATKQITQLDLATSFTPGDLMLVRKTGEAVDKAISQQVVIKSFGATPVVGFKSVSTEDNKVVLTPTNGGAVDQYYDAMTVSFISPITSTSDVQISILNLATKSLQEINTNTATKLVEEKYYEAIYDKTDDRFYCTNTSLASVSGYVADVSGSVPPNRVVIVPSNGAKVDQYYDGMTVSFISPINSTAPQLRIIGLTDKPLQEINTSIASTLVEDKYYEAIFDKTANKFYQTNVSKPYIFTNEYIAVGTVQQGETSTKYALTSAIGATKTNYYPGMSALFTTDITSKGAIIVNIDGLGERSLLDPIGDPIASDILANEALTIIYDGSVFRKHMFTNIEPPVPEDKTFTVGPEGEFINIGIAITGVVNQYTKDGDGRNVTLQLLPGYTYAGERIYRSTPWITIKAADAGTTISTAFKIENPAEITFEGTFNCPGSTGFISINNAIPGQLLGTSILVKNAILNSSSQSSICINVSSINGRKDYPDLTFQNVNVNNFSRLYYDGGERATSCNFCFLYKNGAVATINNPQNILFSAGNITMENVNFGNIEASTSNSILFYSVAGSISMNNVQIFCNTETSPLFVYKISDYTSVLQNCTIKNTSTGTASTISSTGTLLIDGGDYRHTQPGVKADIIAGDAVGSIIRLRNTPQGATRADGRGQIVVE